MSRTKRYVPHWVKENHLHPWIDPLTLEPYKHHNPKTALRAKQREAARLRGDDGRCPVYRYRWYNPMDAIRTEGYKLMRQGYQDHLDALEDKGKEFDWQGIQTNDDWYDDEPMDKSYYLEMIAEEEEYLRQLARDLRDDHLYHYDDPFERDSYDDFQHQDAPSYMSLAHDRVNYNEPGETLGDILERTLALRAKSENKS